MDRVTSECLTEYCLKICRKNTSLDFSEEKASLVAQTVSSLPAMQET